MDEGGHLRQLAPGRTSHFAWAPDGSAIGFIATPTDPGTTPTLAVVNADGSGVHTVVSSTVRNFAWLADSQHVAYSSPRSTQADTVWSVDRSGASPRRIYDAGSLASVVADPRGRWMAINDGGTAVIIDLSQPNAKPRILNPDGRGPGPLVFSPDGSHLAFVDDGQMVVAEVATGSLIRFGSTGSPGRPIGWTASASDVAWYVVDANGRGSAMLSRPDGTDLHLLFPDAMLVSFSPDGQEVAAAVGNVVVEPVSGSPQRTLLRGGTWPTFGPSWAPAGTSIAAVIRSSICVIDAVTGSATRLVAFGDATGPFSPPYWSPIGHRMAFATLGG